jgi:hypothetical protein
MHLIATLTCLSVSARSQPAPPFGTSAT